jgi:hypothetical protein
VITGKKGGLKRKGETKIIEFKSKLRKKGYDKVHPVTCHGGV